MAAGSEERKAVTRSERTREGSADETPPGFWTACLLSGVEVGAGMTLGTIAETGYEVPMIEGIRALFHAWRNQARKADPAC